MTIHEARSRTADLPGACGFITRRKPYDLEALLFSSSPEENGAVQLTENVSSTLLKNSPPL